MILEVAILNVKPGMADSFEKDFETAGQFISSVSGYISHEIRRCMEVKNRYILLVHWKSLEAHTVGFRQSGKYEELRRLLHHYYDPFPAVEHYEKIHSSL